MDAIERDKPRIRIGARCLGGKGDIHVCLVVNPDTRAVSGKHEYRLVYPRFPA